MFYDKFITLCAEKGIKPTPLIVGMGMSSSNVSQWEKGPTPRPEVLKKLADYFGVTVEYLIEKEPLEKEKPVPTDEDEHYTNEDIMLLELIKGLPDGAREREIAYLQSLLNGKDIDTPHG